MLKVDEDVTLYESNVHTTTRDQTTTLDQFQD